MTWEVGSLSEFYTMLESSPVDVVLMDLRLGPGQDTLAATRDVRERFDTRVIIISASLDWEAAAAARTAGASGYLPKDLSIADMVAAIRGLASPNFGRWAFNDMLTPPAGTGGRSAPLHRRLTKRERQVLGEMRRGHTNKEIAAHLSVSTTTVNKHVQKILKKLEVRTRTQAVAMVSEEVVFRYAEAAPRR